MKKIFSIIISLVVISLCFVCPTIAQAESVITFSSDFQTAYMGDYIYEVQYTDDLVFYCEKELPNYIELTEEQRDIVRYVEVLSTEDDSILEVTLKYKNGTTTILTMLRSDCLQTYLDLYDKKEVYRLDVGFYKNEYLEHHGASFESEYLMVGAWELMDCDFYEVTTPCEYDFEQFRGYLLDCDGEYYFVDCDDVLKYWHEIYHFSPYTSENIFAFKINDQELIDKLDKAFGYTGFEYGSNIENILANGFIVFLFAIIPLGLFVAALIASIKAKGIYKKLFKTIWITCAVELFGFVVLLILLL